MLHSPQHRAAECRETGGSDVVYQHQHSQPRLLLPTRAIGQFGFANGLSAASSLPVVRRRNRPRASRHRGQFIQHGQLGQSRDRSEQSVGRGLRRSPSSPWRRRRRRLEPDHPHGRERAANFVEQFDRSQSVIQNALQQLFGGSGPASRHDRHARIRITRSPVLHPLDDHVRPPSVRASTGSTSSDSSSTDTSEVPAARSRRLAVARIVRGRSAQFRSDLIRRSRHRKATRRIRRPCSRAFSRARASTRSPRVFFGSLPRHSVRSAGES